MSELLSTEDFIDSEVGLHDRRHFELKLDYALDPDKTRNRYHVEAYLFSPQALGVNSQSYRTEQFYNDIHAYIRFKTPVIPMSDLLDEDDPSSSLRKVRALLEEVGRSPRDRRLIAKLNRELRLLGCVVRANLKAAERRMGAQIEELGRQSAKRTVLVEDVRQAMGLFLADHALYTERYRALRVDFDQPRVPVTVRETYRAVDEYLVMVGVSRFARLIEHIDASDWPREHMQRSRERLRERLLSERAYRRGAGYPNHRGSEIKGERYIWRRGFLKKFVTSVLWLKADKSPQGRRITQAIGAVAAGIAMFVALMIGVIQAQWWAFGSWPFIASAVIAYMLKDRIKEGLRNFFSLRASRFLADYDVNVTDPLTGRVFGRCQESFGFVRVADLPPNVREHRYQTSESEIERSAKPEVVLKYQKSVLIDSSAVKDNFSGAHFDVKDIIRLDVSEFLLHADDAVTHLPDYIEDEDRVVRATLPKVYHLNVLLYLGVGDGEELARRHVRVVLDRDGIRRLDEIR